MHGRCASQGFLTGRRCPCRLSSSPRSQQALRAKYRAPRSNSVKCHSGSSESKQQEPTQAVGELHETRRQPELSCAPKERATPVDAEVVSEASCSGRTIWDLPSQQSRGTGPKLLSFLGIAGAVAGGGLLGSGFDVSGPGSVAGALGVLAAIITVHECGHFIAARSKNIHVTKFSIGFGPALWTYKGPKVEYSLRAIPLGGYVGFPDDDPDSEYKPDDPDLLRNRPIPDRLLVISAGIIANCIFALSILFVQASTVGMAQATYLPGVRIPKVVAGSVAEAAGIRKGDVVVAVGDRPISSSRENVNRLVQYIKDHPEKRLVFKVARKEGIIDIPLTVDLDADGDGKIGAQLATYAKLTRQAANGPIDAAGKAFNEFGRMVGLVSNGLFQIVTNFSQSKQAVSGPLAIVAAGAEVARSDLASLYQFAAIVNVNLALVNALPLPALDGGYMLLLLVEAVRGKKLDKIVEQTFMASGFLLLTGLGLFLVIRDALNLGQSLL